MPVVVSVAALLDFLPAWERHNGRAMPSLILGLIGLAFWTVVVVLMNDAYGFTVTDDPEDGGANMAASFGYVYLGAIWLAGAAVIALTVWIWRRTPPPN